MNDSLFTLLLSLFEKTLALLQEQPVLDNEAVSAEVISPSVEEPVLPSRVVCIQVEQLNTPKEQSTRVFTPTEQMKLTKASHQFLMRMSSWGLVAPETMELIINRLIFSESHIVSLQETKWTIRHALANGLNAQQLAFLELVLYQKEDHMQLH